MTKLGVFTIDGYDTLIPELMAAPPRVFKAGDPGLLREVHNALGPGVVYVARNFGEVDDFARWDSGRILTDPVGAAKYWLDAFRPAIKIAPFAAWESFNEMSNWSWMPQYGQFEAERQRLMFLEGYKACIGNFATGCPPIKPDNDDPWEYFYPALEACHQYNNLLGLHEYGGLYMDLFYGPNQRESMLAGQRVPFPDEYAEGWLFGRYRKVWHTHIAPNGWTNVKIVITELGLDRCGTDVTDALVGYPVGPWTQCQPYWSAHDHKPDGAYYYMEQLAWADRQMQADLYMVGATIFCRGARSEVWQQWDVRGRVAEYLDPYLRRETQPGNRYRVIAEPGLNLRTHPTTQAAAVAVLSYNDTVTLLSEGGEWSHVTTDSGFTGYVQSRYLVRS